ncbi:hypothetical protein [Nocardia sp. bgisy134]|uniref:hypothetical protein n=1 Tax=Nocardia sp. bgisy134 TaxID=3413789 RepID=UPI003D743368
MIAALAGSATLVAAVAVGVVLTKSDGAAADMVNPLAKVDLTKLRSTDWCAVMKEPLVPSLGEWTTKPESAEWGSCTGTAGRQRFELRVARLEGYRDNGDRVSGVPLLEDVAAEKEGCARALVPAPMEPQFGITVRVQGEQPGDKPCDVAEKAAAAVADRAENGLPLLPDIRNSLARLDPCSLVRPSEIKLSVGPKVPGTPDTAHSCTWFGVNSLTLTLERTEPFVDPTKPIAVEAGGGRVVYVDENELSGTECTRRAIYRVVDADTAEVVRVRMINPSDVRPEGKCLAAVDIVDHVYANLPPKVSR